MTCQTGRPLPDWTKMCDIMYFMLFFLEEIVKINFNNYLLLYEIELVHFIVSNITYYVMLLIDKFLHYSDYLLY